MRYLIIGLGIYGSNLAKDLTEAGHEVVGADVKPALVENIKDYISTAYIIDSTDEAALEGLPLLNVDLVIVAIGENFGASIKTVALLKKLGVKHIFARAIDELHEAILTGMDIDRIITPEQRAARVLTHELALGNDAITMEIMPETYVIKFAAPDYFSGERYTGLNLNDRFGLQLIAATRPVISKNILGVTSAKPTLVNISSDNEHVAPGDWFVCFGTAKAYRAMLKHTNG